MKLVVYYMGMVTIYIALYSIIEAEVSKKQEPPESYLGCYQDDIPRDLSGPHVPFPSDNTPEKCIMICQMSGNLIKFCSFIKIADFKPTEASVW